jgi:SAM-dependent methyltransferase
VVDEGLFRFVRSSLPEPPARVLEVGAGDGALAAMLAGSGYDVVAIDPNGSGDVRPVGLLDLDEPEESFDAAVAVVSLHHVEPLDESCAHLARLLRAGSRLVVDEFDMAAFDVRAASWRLAECGDHEHDPADQVAHMRGHLHSMAKVWTALEPFFALSDPVRGPYLHRWGLGPEHRARELELILAGELPATGARFSGVRVS